MSPVRNKSNMSTDYIIFDPIPISELCGGRLKRYGIQDAQSPQSTDEFRCLADGENNYLWAYGDPVTCFTRWMPNGWPEFILQSIATEFGVKIYSEYELNYEEEDAEGEPNPCYVPLEPPTDEEIAPMRTAWKAECEALDREREKLHKKWQEERETASP